MFLCCEGFIEKFVRPGAKVMMLPLLYSLMQGFRDDKNTTRSLRMNIIARTLHAGVY